MTGELMLMDEKGFSMRFLWILVLVIGQFIFSSCGKPQKKDEPLKEVTVADGVYTAALQPVNRGKVPSVSGKVDVAKYGDSFNIEITVTGVPDGVHLQFMHSESSCPNLTADFNGDGFIDGAEVIKYSGPIIIPLDGDLSARLRGIHEFPHGNYQYRQSTSYALMTSDLYSSTEVFGPHFLPPSEKELSFEQKAIIIYGVPESVSLPDQLGAIDKYSAHESFPIACGILGLKRDYPEIDYEETKPIETRPRTPIRRSTPLEPEIKPDPSPEYSQSWWSRARNGVRRWWCRLRNRSCDDNAVQ
jgi:hypothetical protein